jgi:CheY-like chemotaxis protein
MVSEHSIDSDTMVLVVENEPVDKKMLIDICGEAGFSNKNIHVVAEVDQAIAMLNRGWVDLVLLDLALDEVDDTRRALTLLETWGKETKKKKIPVIVVSRLTQVVKPVARSSCAAVIRKPGPTDGEKAQFNSFLQYAIRTAISKRTDSAIASDSMVLVVENDPVDKQMLIGICREVGFTSKNIYVAGELDQAISLLNRGWVDLVLLDLALDEVEDPSRALNLLETWENETKKKKIPVIVVSRFTQTVKQVARVSCAAVITKPGPTEGEKAQFSEFLQYAIRRAISQTSDSVTLWDRIRRELDRVVSGIGGHPLHVHVAPGVSVPISGVLGRAAVWVGVLGSYAWSLHALAKSKGWPIKIVMGPFIASVLVVVILRLVIRRKH